LAGYIHPSFAKLAKQYKQPKTPLDIVNNLIENKQTRIADAGYTPPEPKDNRNFILKALDIIDRPGNAIRNAIEDKFITGENGFLQGLGEGFTGKEHTYGSDILEQLGVENKIGKGVGGFVLDVALDPLTYFGGFLSKNAAKGLRAANLKHAAKLAEDGIFKTMIAPPVKNFAKGISSTGLPAGKGILEMQDAGQGLAGELGRLIGNIKLGGKHNIGSITNKIYDSINLPFNTTAVSRTATHSGLRSVATYEDAQQMLKQGLERVQQTGRNQIKLENEAINDLTKSILPTLPEDTRTLVRNAVEAPQLMARRILKETNNGVSPYNKKSAKYANAVIHGTLAQADELVKNTESAAQKLASIPMDMVEERAKYQKIYDEYLKAFDIINDVYKRADDYIDEIAGGDATKAQQLREATKYLNMRNEALAIKENLDRTLTLPHYVYHAFEAADGDPATVTKFFNVHKNLNVMNTKIASDKKRLLDTYYDIEKQAKKNAAKNARDLAEIMEGHFTNKEIASLKSEGFDVMLKEARKRGVPIHTLTLRPVIKPVKDIFHIQVARELDSARKIARTNLLDDLYESDLIRHIKEDNDLLKAGWVRLDGMAGLPAKYHKNYAMHPEIARGMKNMEAFLARDENIRGLAKMAMKLQNMWKSSVTAWRPGWYQTTIFGNVFNGMLGDVYNPNRYRYAGMLQAGRNIDDVLRKLNVNQTIKSEIGNIKIKPYTSKQLMKDFRNEGLEGFGQIYGDIGRGSKDIVDNILYKAKLKKKSALKKTGDFFKDAGSAIETNAKLAMFIDQLSKGKTVKEAADHVRKYLFDYSDITRFERGVKKFMPFYTFTRKNLPLQLKTLATRPDKYLAVDRLRRTSLDMAGVSEENRAAMPEWFSERAYGSPFGENKFFTPLFPSDTISDFLSTEEPFMQPLRAVGNMISPLVKTPLFELPANTSLFTGQPIERYKGQTKELFGMDLPAKLAYLLSNIGAARDVNRAINDFMTTKDYTGTVSPVIPLLEQTIREYHPDRAKVYAAYDYDRQLEEFIKMLKASGVDVRNVTEIRKALTKNYLPSTPIRAKGGSN